MSTSLVQLNNLKISYPHSDNLINNMNQLNIYEGDVILITGSSGSGKSSLFYCLKALIPEVITAKVEGEIRFAGKAITQLDNEELMQIGLLQQNPDSQMISRRVIDDLAFGLENLAYSPEDIKLTIKYYSDKFKLNHLLNRFTNSLSGGEKQKIALLGIIITKPKLLLLDEPTAFLDPSAAIEITTYLAMLAKTTTIVIIEHNIHYFKELVTRHWHLNSSTGVLKEGDILSLLWHPEYILIKQPKHYTTKPILEIKNLEYSIGNRTIFKQLNLTVSSGEIVGITGNNGQGKSTLLGMIAKFIPTSNQIFWHNQDIRGITNKDYYQAVGLLMQNPEHHFMHDTVQAELDNEHSIINYFNFIEEQQQNPFSLSVGQKRRLSLAIICGTLKRSLYLLDEPTFGQDFEQKQQLIELIINLQHQGSSFIIVSHDIAFLSGICHKTYNLYQGVLT